MEHNPIVSREEWLVARKNLLTREKEMTHLRDAVNAERLALPWVAIDKAMCSKRREVRRRSPSFSSAAASSSSIISCLAPVGRQAVLAAPFSPIISTECCSHLDHHDVTLTAVSRAPLAKILDYKKRMGWRFPWVSSFGNDFNFDYHVSFTKEERAAGKVLYNFDAIDAADANDEQPGLSAFVKDEAGTRFSTRIRAMRARAGRMDRHFDDPRSGTAWAQREDEDGFCSPPRRIRKGGRHVELLRRLRRFSLHPKHSRKE